MKLYKVTDDELNLLLGYAICYEKENSWIFELSDELDEWTSPLLFSKMVSNGIYTIPRELSYKFIKGRIIPPGRQNISEILHSARMTFYDESKLLELSGGRCSQDSIFFKKIEDTPPFLKERMSRLLTDCVVCDDYSLLCFFYDGTIKKVELSHCTDNTIDKIISNEDLFHSGVICAGGYCVTFNDSLDISAAYLYKNGITIPLKHSDFECFVKNNVLDSSESCEILECTRQNLSYLVNKKVVTPIKGNDKNYLYLKGNVISSKW